MIHIAHPTVFSLTDLFQPSSGGTGLPFLKLSSQGFELSTLLLDLCTGNECGLTVTAVGDRKEADPTVDTDDFRDTVQGDRFCLHSDRYMEKETVVLMDELRGTELPGTGKEVFHTFGMETKADPSLKGVYRTNSFIEKGIVPVPNEIVFIAVEYDMDPLLLLGKNGTIPCDDGAQYRFCHLRLQTIRIPEGVVKLIVQDTMYQDTGTEDIV